MARQSAAAVRPGAISPAAPAQYGPLTHAAAPAPIGAAR